MISRDAGRKYDQEDTRRIQDCNNKRYWVDL